MPEIQEIEKKVTSKADKLHFKYLPAYVEYILNNKLEEFVWDQIRLSREMEVPIMKLFASLSDDEIFKLSLQSNMNNFKIIAENRLSEYMEETMAKWKANELPLITKNQIVIEDVTVGNYIRRNGYLKFLPEYTSDMKLFTGILNELDLFIMEGETQSFKMIELIRNEELNKHLKFIEKIVQTVPTTVFVFDLANRKEVFTNIVAKNFLGYSREEFSQKGEPILFYIIHPDDLPILMEKFNSFSSMSEKDVMTFENRAKHKSGEYRWVRNYVRIFHTNDKGVPTEIIVASLDVTEEKKLAEESHLHEKQLLEAQEISQLGSFIWDLTEKKNSTYSPQMYRIFEMDKFSDLAKFLENVHPADRAKVEEAMQKAFTSEDGLYECEYRYIKNSNEKIIWSRGIVSFEDKKPIRMQGTIMDVTDKHHMVKQLQRSEELYKQAQAISHVGNWTWDLIQNKYEWSDEIFRIYGLTPGTVVNYEEAFSFIHPEDKEMVKTEVEKSVSSQLPYDYQYRVILKNGEMKVLRVKGEVLRDKKGVAYKKLGTVQDITTEYLLNQGLKEREESLNQLVEKIEKANRELERSNQELTNFNYISSHDLQEPLRKINTFSNRIIETDSATLSESSKNYFGRIQASATRMQRLLNDLLEFSKTHSAEKHFEPTNLTDVVKEVKEELKESIEENKVTIECGELPVINGIKFQLHQLFNNIIRNAIKYKRTDVTPVITIKSSVVNSENLGLDNKRGYMKISIADNGIGFDQKHAEKIFEIFQRLHSKNEYDGTGIGLAICKKIMQNHNGFINATGEVNNGAEFNLYFPL